jgi:hypothetical protein
VQWLTVRNREIVRWKSYTDPSSIISAMKVWPRFMAAEILDPAFSIDS